MIAMRPTNRMRWAVERLGGTMLAALVLSGCLTGCSSKAKLREPTKLTKIVEPAITADTAWTRSIGNGADGYVSALRPALEADALYLADIKGRVLALDPKTGARIWRSETKARIISGPTVFDDKILVGTLDAEVIALQRADGKELWRSRISSEVMAPPVGAGKVVVARAGDGREYGLDAADGTRLWTFERGVPSLTLRGMSPPLIVGNRVFTGMDNGKLAALNLDDGQLAWEQTLSVPTGRDPLSQLTDIDADLLNSPGSGLSGVFVVSMGGDIALVDPSGGDSRWRRSVKSYSSMASDGERLYVSDDDGVIWALDAETGAEAWKQEGLKYRRTSAVAVIGGSVVVGDYKGYLHFLKASSGDIIGRTRVGSDPVVAQPVASGDRLYVLDDDGRLRAFDVKGATVTR
jgi:outer membrane protein assembly factor BamB